MPQVPIIEATVTLNGHTNSVDCVCCLPANRNMVVSGSHDHLCKIWDVTASKCIRDFTGHAYFLRLNLHVGMEFGL